MCITDALQVICDIARLAIFGNEFHELCLRCEADLLSSPPGAAGMGLLPGQLAQMKISSTGMPRVPSQPGLQQQAGSSITTADPYFSGAAAGGFGYPYSGGLIDGQPLQVPGSSSGGGSGVASAGDGFLRSDMEDESGLAGSFRLVDGRQTTTAAGNGGFHAPPSDILQQT